MKKKLFFSTFLVFCTSTSQANTCWDNAGKLFDIDPWWLFAIAAVESSFTPAVTNQNKNSSTDLGLMQVNTIHLPMFGKMGISREELQHNNCTNIHAAAFLLRQSINRYGLNIDGIGGYHSGTPSRRRAYGAKVIAKYKELTSRYYVNGESFSFESYKRGGRKPKSQQGNQVVVRQNTPYTVSIQSYVPLSGKVNEWQMKKNTGSY